MAILKGDVGPVDNPTRFSQAGEERQLIVRARLPQVHVDALGQTAGGHLMQHVVQQASLLVPRRAKQDHVIQAAYARQD
ncbi:MAG: hypothetical protein IPM84_26420 [Anaerolineae bacterium]|nr:hypothetical protein [Anaerolineae bacterium]